MLKNFINPLVAKPTAYLLLICLSLFSFKSGNVREVSLPAGTPIALETVQRLASDAVQAGQTVDFKVRSDIKVGDVVVVKAGSIAKGLVTRANIAKGLGKEGQIEIQIKSVSSVDGQQIPVVGNNIYRQGEDKQTLAIVLGVVLCILFLTMKGKNAEIPAGTTIDANTATNMMISIN
ncbi:hypothetical protein LV89_04808 [Arcicella aurantiaca]|uniref:Uncharacterized protein n=1 Tax=Arcicella aurantiaca TaxID=591202 RepID=A0A316DJ88_9BACT|nr:hypothetical protein [Arcicella aurantiaca]PWK16693.1 hypothetical protein LV89_04808 [Arcicella aurantiaca]